MDDLFNIIFNEISNQYDINTQRIINRRIINRRNGHESNTEDIDELYDIFTSFDTDDYSTNQNVIDNMHHIRRHLQNQRNIDNITVTASSYSFPLHTYQEQLSNLYDESINFFELINNFTLPDDLDLDDVKVTLSEEEFSKLKRIKIDDGNKETYNSKCTVCLDEFEIDQNVVLLKCKHYFHDECIRSWLTKQSTKCCTCRFDCRDDRSDNL
jgi:hypothetical protein